MQVWWTNFGSFARLLRLFAQALNVANHGLVRFNSFKQVVILLTAMPHSCWSSTCELGGPQHIKCFVCSNHCHQCLYLTRSMIWRTSACLSWYHQLLRFKKQRPPTLWDQRHRLGLHSLGVVMARILPKCDIGDVFYKNSYAFNDPCCLSWLTGWDKRYSLKPPQFSIAEYQNGSDRCLS